MKRLLAAAFCVLFLAGCGFGRNQIDRAMALRSKLLQSKGCSFLSVITADYGDKLHTFSLECEGDADGNVRFVVSAPESIRGVTGMIDHEGGKLTFDDAVLAFELLADGQVSPVSAPWLFLRSLRSGYLSGCGNEGEGLLLRIDDSYAGQTLQLDVVTDENDMPVRCDLVWSGRRIVSLDVRDFNFL